MPVTLNGTDEALIRDNADVKYLVQYGRKVIAKATIDSLPGAGDRRCIFAFDWLNNLQQHFVIYVDENGKIVLRAHAGSGDYETLSSNAVTAGVEFTVECRVDNATPDAVFHIWLNGTHTQETKAGFVTANWRYDLCERLAIGVIENNTGVKSAWWPGDIDDVEIYDADGSTRLAFFDLDVDGNDAEAGAHHLTAVGSPTFSGGGGGPTITTNHLDSHTPGGVLRGVLRGTR